MMNATPKTPRHPSNGYEVASSESPLRFAESSSPSLVARGILPHRADFTSPPQYASPHVRGNTQRRRSIRLQQRSPGVSKLDLRLDSFHNENFAAKEACWSIDGRTQEHDGKASKRRRSLRLQERQSTPTKQTLPKATEHASTKTKASGVKRRQSAYYGLANSRMLCAENENRVENPNPAVSNDLVEPLDPLSLTKSGHTELVEALEQIASSVLSTVGESVLLINDDTGDDFVCDKENAPNISIVKRRRKGRRDTFDLSRKRGLRVGPSTLENSGTPEMTNSNQTPSCCDNSEDAETFLCKKLVPESCNIDSAMVQHEYDAVSFAFEQAILKKELFVSVTTKSTGATVDATVKDDPCCREMETPQEMNIRMEEMSSDMVEERMKIIFSEFKVYNYPCVSARIFSAMSLLYHHQEDFNRILPLLLSLVNAEIVSLKNREETHDVYFINKRVCFSGYDYSSTMPAVDRICGSHVDLVSSIEALQMVLKEARQLTSQVHSLDLAIQCLDEMGSCDIVSEICSNTLIGYFPSSRFKKAIKHYYDELKDIRCYLAGEDPALSTHIGVRYRLGDFIGRSIRFHLRKLLNSIPESLVDFFFEGCETRWGRAVEDRSISSILNFSLEKINQFMDVCPKLFNDHEELPSFFSKNASALALSHGDKKSHIGLKHMTQDELGEIVADMQEARVFLLGARACKFVWELLRFPGVNQHIQSHGGWDSIEAVANVFHDLQLYENSDNRHFVLLRNVDDLTHLLEHMVERCEASVDVCESSIRKLRRQMLPRQRDQSYRTRGTMMYALRMSLDAEIGESFPVPIATFKC
eukprot:CCRYP_003712-RB/>CCRYP_003712-RB protein AED:0.03 eAED:0.03 QI:190/1/1/1/0.5/0.33/3/619/813